jgi:6-phosphogluconate dehydrogenase
MEFSLLLLISLFIVIIYNILNYLDMRFIQKEYKPMKIIMKDSIIIIISSIFSLWVFTKYEHYFLDFFSIIMNTTGVKNGAMNKLQDIPVFTDIPDF